MEADRTGLFSYTKRVFLFDFVQAVEDCAVVLNANASMLLDIQEVCSSRISWSYMASAIGGTLKYLDISENNYPEN